MIVAVIAGVLSYFRLGRSEDPTFIIKTMVVQAAWPGATIEETAQAGHRAARAQAAGNAAPRFPAQLHARRRHDDLRQPEGQRERQGSCRHLVSGSQERRRYPPHAAGRHRRARLQRRFRRYVRDHLRLHGRRLHASRAARLCRGRPLEAAPGARRIEDRVAGRAGREDLRRILDEGARQPGHRPHRR